MDIVHPIDTQKLLDGIDRTINGKRQRVFINNGNAPDAFGGNNASNVVELYSLLSAAAQKIRELS